jgi:hypothetical protein
MCQSVKTSMSERAGQVGTGTAVQGAQVPAIRVWKFPLELHTVAQNLTMPYGATILHVHAQDDRPVMWAEVNVASPGVTRTFFVVPTGMADVPMGSHYVGTVHIEWTVWHIYEVKR